ncbi:ABC transporter permease [Advenella kashmirensis WT001]|uniref:ABC transporter permease n=1 Tax=Advenella kashmirensis (strain DSM 17095 / LMG 22695 / WT001) TaxID=1036672 RepID=I3U936_ADVKW|nr:ABC transporter permease [Advenella kashmirensis]AFK61524.1 ABC transporter permease [Advenella kashmirensis WT001]
MMYFLRLLVYSLPVLLGVAFLCFSLIHIAPGDPLISVMPPDASEALRSQMMSIYGFDQPFLIQFWNWLWRALQGDLGMSIATSRPVATEVIAAVGNSLRLAVIAVLIGFSLGVVFGMISGYARNSIWDRLASLSSIFGVSIPHYWLGMVLVIVFSVYLNWFPATGSAAGDGTGWRWDWDHVQYMILPAITMSVIPMGIVARTIRALVSDILSREFMVGLQARGLGRGRMFMHLVKNVAPTALSVMGLQLGYLLGGSILIETVFSWPGAGFLLNSAVFQRDFPLLQGTILIMAIFFVLLNLLVDTVQTWLDPRIQR